MSLILNVLITPNVTGVLIPIPQYPLYTATLAQFSENPGEPHWDAVKRVFRYLLGTRSLSLVYGGHRKELEGFVDADGAGGGAAPSGLGAAPGEAAMGAGTRGG